MVKIKHKGENQDKIDFIIQMAQNRFGLYGLEKTTMSEIAADAGMSKASMYYYFPDKISLFLAVISKEQKDFFNYLEESYDRFHQPDERLRSYIDIRNQYFLKLINISKLRYDAIRELRPVMRDLIAQLRDKELIYIENILEEGKKAGAFRSFDEKDAAIIFLEALQAIRRSSLGKAELMGLGSLDLKTMENKMDLFLDIFIKGISVQKK